MPFCLHFTRVLVHAPTDSISSQLFALAFSCVLFISQCRKRNIFCIDLEIVCMCGTRNALLFRKIATGFRCLRNKWLCFCLQMSVMHFACAKYYYWVPLQRVSHFCICQRSEYLESVINSKIELKVFRWWLIHVARTLYRVRIHRNARNACVKTIAYANRCLPISQMDKLPSSFRLNDMSEWVWYEWYE